MNLGIVRFVVTGLDDKAQWMSNAFVSGAYRLGKPENSAYSLAMDLLTLFGLVAVSLMLVFYAFEKRSPWCVFGFALGCALASAYGFLEGAWPFGGVEAIWSIVALRRWLDRARALSRSRRPDL